MISNAQEYLIATERLVDLSQAVKSFAVEHPEASAKWRAIMTGGFIEDIQSIQRDIVEYCSAQATEASADLLVSLEGRGLANGNAPSSILTAVLDALRRGIRIAAEVLTERRPISGLRQATDWQVLGLYTGSARVAISLPQPGSELWGNEATAAVRDAVVKVLQVAEWAASGAGLETLSDQFPTPEQRRVLLNAVKPFAPRQRGRLRRVILSGKLVPGKQTIVLTREAPRRIDDAIDRIAKREAKTELEEHEGDLREIDLDLLTLTVRQPGGVMEVRCLIEESLLESAQDALDKRVKVYGIRTRGQGRRAPSLPLFVYRLDVLEEDSEQDDEDAAKTPKDSPDTSPSREG